MAFLNQAQRKALLDELSGMRLWRAKFKLRLLDPKCRLPALPAQCPAIRRVAYQLHPRDFGHASDPGRGQPRRQ